MLFDEAYLFEQNVPEIAWQPDVFHIDSVLEEGRNLGRLEAGDATTDACDKECELLMSLGEGYKFVDVWLYRFHSALHSGYAVTPALQSHALSHYCPEVPDSRTRSAAAVHSSQIAAEYEYLTVVELAYIPWCYTLSVFLFHVKTDRLMMFK